MELMQQPEGQQRQPLASSLRWLQFSLLLLFGHDVLCFSLGYPFLPQVFGGAATGIAFSCYGLASIGVLLLLLFCSSSTSSNSSAAKFWRILSAAAFEAVAGAANTALPASYSVLLLTKAAQGTASALYFCESLSLVAAVYPRAYRTQAMAFISAGLTVGDALGPVIGGLVYQAAGLQGALALQPAASLVAVAALGLLLVWPVGSRPWSLQSTKQQQQQEEQQIQQQSDEEQGYAQLAAVSCCAGDLGGSSSRAGGFQQQGMHSAGSKGRVSKPCQDSLIEPLLAHDQQPPATAAAAAADAAPLLQPYAACEAPLQHANHSQQPCPSHPQQRHQQLQLQRSTHDTTSSAAADPTAAAAAGDCSRPQLLLQLLRHPSIVSLCLLAFMAQAARTAVDLLLPIMLGAAVQPGVIGLLFAGEAVGSVVAPFLIDWLLHRHGSSNSSSSSRHSSSDQETSSSSSSSSKTSSSSSLASWLLLLSATGMALCCAAVLTLWQLPAALHSVPAVAQQPAAAADTPTHLPLLLRHPATAAQYTTGLGADVQNSVGCQQGAFGGIIWTGNSNNSSNGGGSMSSRLCDLVVLKGLQHPHWDAYSATLAPGHTVGSTMTPTSSFGSVVVGGLGFSGVAAGHADGNSFGCVELSIIGFVLMLLGSWHSSCETLIYTVLTDLITPPTSDNDHNVIHAAVTVSGLDGSDVLLGACPGCASQRRVCGESADACNHGCGTYALQNSRYCESECCREGAACLRHQRQPGNGTVGVDASAAAFAGSVVTVCGVCSSTAGSDADSNSGSSSADGDMEVSVEDGSSPSSSGSHCEAVCGSAKDTSALDSVCVGCCWHSDCADLRHADDALAGGLRLSPSASEATTGYAAQDSQQSFDCSEVVMVLYVLFWVMGFSAGAGVVGLMPGTSLIELQAVATVLAVLLAVAGRWTWMAVGL